MTIDLNDESTWDVDDAELLAMATSGVVPTVDPPKEEVTPEVVVTPEPAPEPVAEAPKLRPLTVEPKDTDILAADGKNLIPHGVLKQTREDLHATQAQLEQAQAELAALRAAQQAPAAVVEAAPVNGLPEDVKEQVERIRQNWGDDIAAQAERTYRLEQQTRQQQKTIEQLTQHVQQQQETAKRSEADIIEEAIAASPKLSAWAQAENQDWFDRSTALHTTLLKVDPAYAAASWYDKMKQLPEKVEALFGASFEKVEPVDTRGVAAKIKAVVEAPPTSLSELSGGAPPERTELEKIEDLKGNELTAFFTRLSADPAKFEKYLRSVS